MVYLGLLKAEAAGYRPGLDLGRASEPPSSRGSTRRTCVRATSASICGRTRAGGHGRAEELVLRLESALTRAGGLAACEGQELAWIVLGLGHAAANGCARAEPLLGEALELLLRSRAPGGLAYHFAAPGRRRFSNFATQAYGVLALATAARLGLDARAAPAATSIAESLISLQLPDGGWAWLYDAEQGRVVERYELYSVHQHAMAPMALLELADATGDELLARAALHGLGWIHGRNELGLDMVDREQAIVYRSIRRKLPWARLFLYANTGAAYAVRRAVLGQGRRVELNAGSRPYELGWLLEAWCGREAVLEKADEAGT